MVATARVPDDMATTAPSQQATNRRMKVNNMKPIAITNEPILLS